MEQSKKVGVRAVQWKKVSKRINSSFLDQHKDDNYDVISYKTASLMVRPI